MDLSMVTMCKSMRGLNSDQCTSGGCETVHSDNDEELAMERKLYDLGVVLNMEEAQSPF